MSHWQPIETVQRREESSPLYILISDGVSALDLVTWRDDRPGYSVKGIFFCAAREGWFTRSGDRSRVRNPKVWMHLPTLPDREALSDWRARRSAGSPEMRTPIAAE